MYHFQALCFGPLTAPRAFTKVFAAVSASARSRGIRLLGYLDAWWVLASSEREATHAVRSLLSLSRHPRNGDQREEVRPSALTARAVLRYDHCYRVFPSMARVEKFLAVAESFCSVISPPAQLWQVVLSHLALLDHLVPHGRLRLRSMQWHLESH